MTDGNVNEATSVKTKSAQPRRAPSDGSAWRPAIEYASKPGAWWEGRRVRLLRDIRTRGGDLCRKRRIVKVDRKYGGLTLKGRKFFVTHVRYYGLEVDTTPNEKFS